MRKRLMAALLCLCLMMGMWTTAAYASEIPDTELDGAGDTIIEGDGNTPSDDDPIIEDDGIIEMLPTSSGNALTVDNIASTTGSNYAEFDTEAEVAYTQGIDIYAQAFDSAIANATHVYKVEIVWGDMAFAWGATDEITKTWHPNEHSYTDDADSREKKWYLLDETTELTQLEYDTDGTYASILSGTAQSYVVMFNHSDQPVNANVKITEIYQSAEDINNSDNIIAALTPVDGFGSTATTAADDSYDYLLNYDTVTGVIYSKDNGTAAALSVGLDGEPVDGVLNADTNTTVARITITLSIPDSTTGGEPGNVEEGGSQEPGNSEENGSEE